MQFTTRIGWFEDVVEKKQMIHRWLTREE